MCEYCNFFHVTLFVPSNVVFDVEIYHLCTLISEKKTKKQQIINIPCLDVLNIWILSSHRMIIKKKYDRHEAVFYKFVLINYIIYK